MRRAFVRSGYDITPEQWSVLMRLYEHGRMNHNELAERTLKEMSTLSRIVEILRKKELVIKKKDNKDRRVSLLILTEKGKIFCEQTIGIARQIRENSIRGIDPVEVEQVISVLNRILTNLEGEGIR